MHDATTLAVPLWGAVGGFGSLLVALVSLVAWVFMTFDRSSVAVKRHEALEGRVEKQDHLLGKVAQDVSYIRGRLEPKD